jgi:hypothetical protein
MRMTTLLASASTLAFVFSIGSVSAADQSVPSSVKQFNTLNGVKAVQMSASEMKVVKGMDHHFFVNGVRHDTDQQQDSLSCTSADPTVCPVIIEKNFVEITRADGSVRLAAPSYNGLILHACGNGVISGPSATWCVP